MDELKEKRQQLMDKISKYNARIFNLQNELLNIEQLIVESDHKEIMETLTLNEQQLNVINSKDKYTLVIACPGSGKTHTLISMYIKLIVQDKINPDNVLLITFTKKAGQEMSGRLSSLVPTKLPAYVGSLHGLSYRVLQEYKNINYTVLDEKESKNIIKELCDDFLDIDDSETFLIDWQSDKKREIVDRIQSIPQEAIDKVHQYQDKMSRYKSENLNKLYKEIEKIKVISVKESDNKEDYDWYNNYLDVTISYLGSEYDLKMYFNNKTTCGFNSDEFDKVFKHKYSKYGRELSSYLFDKVMELCKKNNISINKHKSEK